MRQLSQHQIEQLKKANILYSTGVTHSNGFVGTAYKFKTRRLAEKANKLVFGDISPISKYSENEYGFAIY
jgi:hypothetical protein